MCRVTKELPVPLQVAIPQQLAALTVPTIKTVSTSSPDSKFLVQSTESDRIESKPCITSQKSSNVYKVGPLIREGRFGSIHMGLQLQSSPVSIPEQYQRYEQKPVALKIYNLQQLQDLQLPDARSASIENPWHEIEIQSVIGEYYQKAKIPQHLQTLVGIIETTIIDNNLVLVMPYFDGGDLLDVIEGSPEQPGLPVATVKKMFKEIIHAVHLLHENEIIHRDLSVENVLYNQEQDYFAICDFGMSTKLSNLSSSTEPAPCCGKEGYIAPELWKRNLPASAIDLKACDIWSCGIILFMALTGSAPLGRAVEYDPYYSMISNPGGLMKMMEPYLVNFEDERIQGLELVASILMKNPCERPKAHEILQNSWLN